MFEWAVVRLAIYKARLAERSRLLFGSVSLLAPDRPQPVSAPPVDHIDVGRYGQVRHVRFALPADQAVRWYRGASFDERSLRAADRPVEVDAVLSEGLNAGPDFVDDPEWPSFGLPIASEELFAPGRAGDPAPFLGSGDGTARIHRRFGNGGGFAEVLSNPEIMRFIATRLHLDLVDYSEYLGSLVLVMPDPILRGVQHYVTLREEGNGEDLVYRLLPRPGRGVAGMTLTVLERRANLLSRFETVDVPADGLLVLPRSLPVQASGYVVVHPAFGVLEFQTPVPFIRQIRVSTTLVGQRPVANLSNPAGDDVVPSAALRIAEAEERRARKAGARRYAQTWFDEGEGDGPAAFVRTRLYRAQIAALVFDPYFAARELAEFMGAVPSTAVPLTILTSRHAFQRSRQEEDSDPTDPEDASVSSRVRRAKAELGRLRRFARTRGEFEARVSLSVWVVIGDVTFFDRLLIVDDAVWLLGNALDARRAHASLIVQVPDGEPVIRKVERIKAETLSFDAYVRRREKYLNNIVGGS